MSAVRAKTKPEAPAANGQRGENPRATDDTPAKASGNDRLLAEYQREVGGALASARERVETAGAPTRA